MYLPSLMRLSLLGSGFPAGNVPSGTALIMFDLRGNSPKAKGARVDVAPQKQSAATKVSFSMLMVPTSISMYGSMASTSSVEPTASHCDHSYASSSRTFSVASCSSMVRLMPSLLNTFNPLYCGGLWLAVISTPASDPVSPIIHAVTGVGTRPTWRTSAPQALIPEVSAISSIGPEIRGSKPTTTCPPLFMVAMAAPTR